MAGGWKKFHSKILEWRWYTDANTFRLFFHLIMTASYEDKPWKKIIVKRGQRIASRNSLSEELHLSQKQIRTALDHLKETGEVATVWAGDYSIITILNYDKYQDKYCEAEIDVDEERAKSGPSKKGKIQQIYKKGANKRANYNTSIEADNDTSRANERAESGPSRGQREGHIYRDIDTVDNIDDIDTTTANPSDSIPYQEIQKAYNETCTGLPKVVALTEPRRKAIRARWNTYPGIETFKELFVKTARSDFLNGSNDRNWRADFDWLMKEHNMAKVLEGKFDFKRGTAADAKTKPSDRPSARYVEQHDEDEYKRFEISSMSELRERNKLVGVPGRALDKKNG